MSPRITLRRRSDDDVPADSHVCHYDELEENAKEQFPIIATDRSSATVDRSVAAGFDGCDYVKYTEYYEIALE